MRLLFVALVICFLSLKSEISSGSKILAIIPIPSFSHQIAYQPLWKTLTRRGHQVTLVTTNPIPDKNLTNLRQIDVNHSYKALREIDFFHERDKRTWQNILADLLYKVAVTISENVFTHPDMKKIYAPGSDEKFDVVIAEAVITPACFAFAHRFQAPLIGVYSLGLTLPSHYAVGNPVLPSHPSNWEGGVNDFNNMPFWKRVKNYVLSWKHIHIDTVNGLYIPQQKIAEKYLGDVPSIRDLEKNISIMFVNQQPEISYTTPSVPNIKFFGGLHVTDERKFLPKELKEFADNAPNGFIYVSMGTNVNPLSFTEELKNIFMEVLSSLPMKVVWKFKGKFSKMPDNIYMAEWLPQQGILAHPNIKLFIYQGGLQSTEEALMFGVPLIGIPILADQDMQVRKLASLGVCKQLDIFKLTKESFNEAIREVLYDKSYKENVVELCRLLKDKPREMMEEVIWWIEHVIRNKGAPHLRSSTADELWYQRENMDVIAFLSIALFVMAFVSLCVLYKILVLIVKYYVTSVTNSKQKVS